MNGTTCTACGMALFSDAACYGDLRAPLCYHCWLEWLDTPDGRDYSLAGMVRDEAAWRHDEPALLIGSDHA